MRGLCPNFELMEKEERRVRELRQARVYKTIVHYGLIITNITVIVMIVKTLLEKAA